MPNRDLAPWSGGRGPARYERDPLETLRRRMDRLFDSVWGPDEGRSFAPTSAPVMIDLDENPQAYVVKAELPGIDQKDIELTLRDNALVIRGEKRDERREGEGNHVYMERRYGRFERTIPFDLEVDADKVQAACQNGVLTVTLPKNPSAKDKSRRIEIQPQSSGEAPGTE